MAEFSGKIVDAHYADADYSVVKIRYEEGGKLFVYHVHVNPDHPDYQALIDEGWDQEKLIESTAEVKRAQSAAFNIEVNNAAKKLADEMIAERGLHNPKDIQREARKIVNERDSDFYKSILDENEDKDSLFKFKLWILEQDFAKGIEKEKRSKIRKATRMTQLFGILDELIS